MGQPQQQVVLVQVDQHQEHREHREQMEHQALLLQHQQRLELMHLVDLQHQLVAYLVD